MVLHPDHAHLFIANPEDLPEDFTLAPPNDPTFMETGCIERDCKIACRIVRHDGSQRVWSRRTTGGIVGLPPKDDQPNMSFRFYHWGDEDDDPDFMQVAIKDLSAPKVPRDNLVAFAQAIHKLDDEGR